MSNHNLDFDKFDSYEQQFDPLYTDRRERRKRRTKQKHQPKKTEQEIIVDLADARALEGGFNPSYQPARYEKEWLISSLYNFYEQHLITDVLAQIKGGKEASVYRCQAHPTMEVPFLAAKVYRPRRFRNLRNDKMYREGRVVLGSDGRPLKERDRRSMKALDKKTTFGAQLAHTSWLMHEFTTLEKLYQLGASVPQPIATTENAILMSYYGDEQMAASTLNHISLPQDEATQLFNKVLTNIELMLQHGLIHGDLSAYNILYWAGEIIIIDFPQVINGQNNQHAQFILKRDIKRICNYFQEQGVSCNDKQVFETFWQRYLALSPEDEAAEKSRLEATLEHEEEREDKHSK